MFEYLPEVIAGINTLSSIGGAIYQGNQQNKLWEREDNAVQRRVADLKAAGLSPTLAAGSAASTSQPIRIAPPQIDLVGAIQLEQLKQEKDKTKIVANQKYLSGLDVETRYSQSKVEQALGNYLGVKDVEYNNPGLPRAKDLSPTLQLGKALYDKMMAESQVDVRKAEEIIRNTDIYKKYNVPSDSAAADSVGLAQMMDSKSGYSGVFASILEALRQIQGIRR